MSAVSEVWLKGLEDTYSGTRGNLSDAAVIRDLLMEVRKLQKQVFKLNNYGSAEIRRLTKERDYARRALKDATEEGDAMRTTICTW